MPDVTVVIPLYNKAAEIERAVTGVLGQTGCDLSLIVVDDGSTDNSAERVAAFKDPRLTLMRQANKGASAARNSGWRAAETELVAFLDADDEWKPGFLAEALALGTRYPQAAIWAVAYSLVTDDGRVVDKVRFKGVPCDRDGGLIPDFFAAMLGYDPVHSSSALVKKSVLEEVGGFPEGEVLSEDQDTWSRIALKYPIAFLPTPLVVLHQNASNRVTEYHRHSGEETCLMRTLKAALTRPGSGMSERDSIKAFLCEHIRGVAAQCITAGNGKRARELIDEARSYGASGSRWRALKARSYMPVQLQSLIEKGSRLERALRHRRKLRRF